MKQLRLFLIIILVLIGGYYLFSTLFIDKIIPMDNDQPSIINVIDSSNSSITKNWQTYYNEHYNFSFKYPGDFTVEENEIEFAGQTHPQLKISSKKNNLSLALNYKIEFGLTEQGFDSNEYSQLKTDPQLIRVAQNEYYWIYFKRLKAGQCFPMNNGSNNVSDNTQGIKCYDVNFPFNWSFELMAKNTDYNHQDLIIFDQIIYSLEVGEIY